MAKMEKKVYFYDHILTIPPSLGYINVELQVFHLTLILNTDGGGGRGGCHLCIGIKT